MREFAIHEAGHCARECTNHELPPGDMRLCKYNCYKQGHIAAECTNDEACKNCRKAGHLARDCQSEPVCNLCNVAGHLAGQCPKSDINRDGIWWRLCGRFWIRRWWVPRRDL